MKFLNTNPITDTQQFPLKKGTLQFLQEAHVETVAAVIKALIGNFYDPNVYYVLSGCVNSGSGQNFNITEGYIFNYGYVNYVPAVNFTAPAGQVAILLQNVLSYTLDADPVTFSNGSVYGVHNDFQWDIRAGVAGSGEVNFSSLYRLQLAIPPQLSLTGTGAATVTGTFPNINVNVPDFTAPNLSLLWIGRFNAVSGINTKLGGTATVTSLTRTAVGTYSVVHNIGNTKYFVDGVCVQNNLLCNLRQFLDQTALTFRYTMSDDDSVNDCDHELRIYGYV